MNLSNSITEWIRFSDMDYDVARRMAKEFYPVPLEVICYHCQQSAEKILKAYALEKEEPLIKTHNLDVLLNQCLNSVSHSKWRCKYHIMPLQTRQHSLARKLQDFSLF